MTISDTLKKVQHSVISTAKRTVHDSVATAKRTAEGAIANERARKNSLKTAWKDMGDGKRARNIESYGEFAPAIIWVVGDKVYVTDAYKASVVEITGDEAEMFRSSSEGSAAITKNPRTGFGSVSPADVQIPDYLTGAPKSGQDSKPRKTAQTWEEWMGLK